MVNLTRRQNVSSIVLSMTYNPNNSKLAVADSFKNIFIVDLEDDERKIECVRAPANVKRITSLKEKLTFCANGKVFVQNWNGDSPQAVSCLAGHHIRDIEVVNDSVVGLTKQGQFLQIGENGVSEMPIKLAEDMCQSFKVVDDSTMVVNTVDRDWTNTLKVFDLRSRDVVKSIKLKSQPQTLDVRNHFAIMATASQKVELMHIYSGELVTTLEEPRQLKAKTGYHTACYHPNGTIITATYGSSILNLYASNGQFRRELQCDFNTSSLAFENDSDSIAVGGFSNKIDLFHDLVFKSETISI